MILVFGKTGQVANELQDFEFVKALGREQADLSDPEACARAIKFYRPQAVTNAAAYTAVDKAESEEDLANIINGSTTGVFLWKKVRTLWGGYSLRGRLSL